MNPDLLLAHYHEIGLKGRNRGLFEDALSRNTKRALRATETGGDFGPMMATEPVRNHPTADTMFNRRAADIHVD